MTFEEKGGDLFCLEMNGSEVEHFAWMLGAATAGALRANEQALVLALIHFACALGIDAF